MVSHEQEKILSALQTSIRMETDGKAFYLKASTDSTNDAGKKLLSQLAVEEDAHRQLFEQIYETYRKANSWPDVELKASPRPSTLFSPAGAKSAKPAPAKSNEIEAVKIALEMESKSYDFYEAQLKTAGFDSEKRFYKALAAQERGHHLVLLDYLEFLQNPSSYFIKMEHHSLDGA